MIQDTQTVLYSLQNYKSPRSKITQLLRKGKLIQLRRGLFETDSRTPPYALAAAIYGPSYISFEYALGWYGLIPERVTTITSAVFRKNKIKEFKTPFGLYSYQPVPARVYPYAVTMLAENGYNWQMASAEKAICDTLNKALPVKTLREMQKLLFESWRMEPEMLSSLNLSDIRFLAPLYHKRNPLLFLELLDNTGENVQ
ncbi:MAG: hypothetical protein LKF96_12265 [Treponema sp.]|jgi:predicted transcriptional regulator of viral defense system|nr:hypothetical protein [Treponema sp.]